MSIEVFRSEMARAGLRFDGPIIADGRIHRFRADGDHGKNSWYVLHSGPPMAGAFGCWKRDVKETWCERKRDYSPTEWQRIRESWQQAEQERHQTEKELQARARKTAERILQRSEPARDDHAYLKRKRVDVHGELRLWRGALVLPLRDVNGELHSLQFISPAGEKRFLRGGRVAGCFFVVNDNPTAPLVICEGFATGASIHESADYSVVCAMNAGNVMAVAKALRERWQTREIIIAADNDAWTAGNPGVSHAREAALALGAKLAVPVFKDVASKPTDFNDLHQLEGADEVRRQIESATVPAETDQEILAKAASMPVIEYERQREQLAARLRIRVSVLDEEIRKVRPRSESIDNLQGRSLNLHSPEPWPEPVDGAEVLSKVSEEISNYVSLPLGAADAIALWCCHCHCFEVFDHTPRLNITSPEKRCGKTTLRDVVACLVPKPLATENLSSAVLFRVVELHKPTLLADECDGWLTEDQELLSLLNAGHRRGGQAIRCEGDEHEVRAFSVFSPAVLCGIGSLPGTLADRSIVIRLERAARGEIRKRFDSRRTSHLSELCRMLARWCLDNRNRLEQCEPTLPETCFNRLADCWRPLFTLAEVAGGAWPARCAQAFEALTGQADEAGTGEMMLSDIQGIFAELKVDRMASNELAQLLASREDRPWSEWRHGKAITAAGVARVLGRFKIRPRTIRLADGSTPKGYVLADFEPVFMRYLPQKPENAATKRHTATSLIANDLQQKQNATCGGSNSSQVLDNEQCGVVAFSNPENAATEQKDGARQPLLAI